MIGEVCALIAAACYTLMCAIFQDCIKAGSPLQLNFLRGLVCVVATSAVLLLFADHVIPSASAKMIALLALSGALGIGVGDSFYFNALQKLGAKKTILLETLAPPFTGIAAYVYYGTTISIGAWVGMLVTVYGIYIVVSEKHEEKQNVTNEEELLSTAELPILDQNKEEKLYNVQTSQSLTINAVGEKSSTDQTSWVKKVLGKNAEGLVNGILFTICQAMGVILSHHGQSTGEFSPLQTAFLRMSVGTLTVALLILAQGKTLFYWPWKTSKHNSLFFSGVFFGPFLGNWAMQTSIASTRPEVMQTLFATTPLWGLLITWYKGEHIQKKDIIGSLVSILGVSLVVWL